MSAAMQGRQFSATHRENMSSALVGRRHSLATRAKMSIAVRAKGEKSHAWKGGRTPVSKAARLTRDYRQWRGAVFERDDHTCQGCGKRGGELNAHHAKPFATHPELRTELSNGITLCKPCHRLAHARI